MNYRMMARFVSGMIAVEAAFMLPALLIAFFGDRNSLESIGFLVSMVLAAGLAFLLYHFSKEAKGGFYAREGLVCVSVGWIVLSILGSLPFLLSGAIPRPIDAMFEIVSGFTTTGASILTEVESLPKGILYWRSFSHWLGGMGVLVFLLVVMPNNATQAKSKSTGFTLHLLRAESPGPSVGKLVPKMRQTAVILYFIYLVLTILNVIFLLIGQLPVFDAFCIAFGTAGTGGFGIKNDSLGSYSPYIQNVTTVFMILFGVNFTCYYLLAYGKIKSVLKDEELRLYFGIIAAAILLITLNVKDMFASVGEAVHHAAFTVGSIITTTGYGTVDFDKWPSFSKSIILFLMIVGACAGSTGGGMKCSRVVLLFKGLHRNIKQAIHPQVVQTVRVNDRVIDEAVLANTNAYLSAYVIMIIISMMVISIDGFSIEATISSVLCTLNNIGPGLAEAGPTCNFSAFSDVSKAVMIFDMLAGRLELFPILALFSRSTWRKM